MTAVNLLSKRFAPRPRNFCAYFPAGTVPTANIILGRPDEQTPTHPLQSEHSPAKSHKCFSFPTNQAISLSDTQANSQVCYDPCGLSYVIGSRLDSSRNAERHNESTISSFNQCCWWAILVMVDDSSPEHVHGSS